MCGIAGCYQQADGHKLTDIWQIADVVRTADGGPAPELGRVIEESARLAADVPVSSFTTASTTAQAVLEDESLDAIFVVIRYATHADLEQV